MKKNSPGSVTILPTQGPLGQASTKFRSHCDLYIEAFPERGAGQCCALNEPWTDQFATSDRIRCDPYDGHLQTMLSGSCLFLAFFHPRKHVTGDFCYKAARYANPLWLWLVAEFEVFPLEIILEHTIFDLYIPSSDLQCVRGHNVLEGVLSALEIVHVSVLPLVRCVEEWEANRMAILDIL